MARVIPFYCVFVNLAEFIFTTFVRSSCSVICVVKKSSAKKILSFDSNFVEFVYELCGFLADDRLRAGMCD